MKVLNILFSVFIIGLFLACTKANGADWKFYAKTVNRDIKYYYNAESINHNSKNIVSVWIKIIPLSEEIKDKTIQKREKLRLTIEGYENYEYSLRLKEINCADKMHSISSYVDYDKKLSVLDSFYYNSPEWAPIVPDSSGESLYMLVCSQTTHQQ